MRSVQQAEVVEVNREGVEVRPDLLAMEEPLEIRLGFGAHNDRQQRNLAITMRTPGHDFELALGFLFTEGIISSYRDVADIRYCIDQEKSEEKQNIVKVSLQPHVVLDFKRLERHFYTSSSCGVCGKASIESVKTVCPVIHTSIRIDPHIIHQAPGLLRQAQQVFQHTGGLHAAGLFTPEGVLKHMREDVGRHNALDKLIGAALGEGLLPLSDYFVLVSGRTSFELVQKSLMAGVPVLAAVSAPSSLAVKLASDFGMTLIGFVRGERFNIYSGHNRVNISYEN